MDPSVQEANIRQLSPPQAHVLDAGLLDSGFNCVLQMPTGSGKTWLAEQAIGMALGRGARAIYLTPLRALATEMATRWQTRFPDTPIGVFTGDFGVPGRPYPVPFKDARLMVTTPERLDACTRAWHAHWAWIPQVDLIVVDEIHLLGDRHRGARLEGALDRIRRLNPFVRLVGLSATLGNREELAAWLSGVDYASSWRPVPLRWRLVRYRNAADKPGLLLSEVTRNIQRGGQSLVFVQSRRRAEELSRHLLVAGIRAHHHHAGLPHGERQTVERQFRDGDLQVLIATATLELGINLPVRQVVLYDLQTFDGVDFRPLSTNSVWQRIGRAGRRGLDDEGEAVLLTPAWDHDSEHYFRGQFEPIRSGLSDARALAEQIVAEVASGMSRSYAQLEAVFARSLAAHQHTLPCVNTIINEMRTAGMLEEAPDRTAMGAAIYLKATRLGYIAARHLLAPATLVLFHRALTEYPALTFFDLLLVAAAGDDCEPLLPVDFEELDEVASVLAHESSHLLQLPQSQLAHLLGIEGKRMLTAIKTAVVIREWTRLGNAMLVAEKLGCYPFEVERLRESFNRLLLAMAAIQPPSVKDLPVPDWLTEEHVPLQERISVLKRMIANGLDETTITLTLVDGIGATMAGRLKAAGVAHIEDLALVEPSDLQHIRGLAPVRAQQWITSARDLVRSRSARRYQESGPVVAVAPADWLPDIDPYRLRRALDLKITGSDGGVLCVTGGLEPHLVHIDQQHLVCDCIDARHTDQCKHVLAVRLHRGDRNLRALARRLRQFTPNARLDLFDLWFASGAKVRRR